MGDYPVNRKVDAVSNSGSFSPWTIFVLTLQDILSLSLSLSLWVCVCVCVCVQSGILSRLCTPHERFAHWGVRRRDTYRAVVCAWVSIDRTRICAQWTPVSTTKLNLETNNRLIRSFQTRFALTDMQYQTELFQASRHCYCYWVVVGVVVGGGWCWRCYLGFCWWRCAGFNDCNVFAVAAILFM